MTLNNTKQAQRAVGFFPGGVDETGEFYSTPAIAIEKLLAVEKFTGPILEPCCGIGGISIPLTEAGYTVVSRDLLDWGFGEVGKNFLTEPVEDFDAVVTNPPFSLSLPFILKSLECTKNKQGKVAFLCRLQWLEGVARSEKLFKKYPISRVWVFAKRIPRFNRYDYTGKQGTSMMGFAWYVFDWKYDGEPRIGWI